MENATKALLIAGGMIITVMLASLLAFGYNRLASSYQLENELLTNEQLDKFNKQFQNYRGEVIRGNELISLMNKVIDYNASQVDDKEIQYKRIKVNIQIGSDHLKEFKLQIGDDWVGDSNDNLKEANITNYDKNTNEWKSDKNLIAITNTPDNLIKNSGINNLTDTQLQKLTMEATSILLPDDVETNAKDPDSREKRRIRADLLKNILKFNTVKGEKTPGVEYDLVFNDEYIATERSRKD